MSGMCPVCLKCCFVRRFSVRQVNRFDWGESRTRHRVGTPHLPALWAPAKELTVPELELGLDGGMRPSPAWVTPRQLPPDSSTGSACKSHTHSRLRFSTKGQMSTRVDEEAPKSGLLAMF